MVLTQVSMSRSGRMLFVGTNTGTIRAMKFPLTVPGEWQEHQAHTGAITKVLNCLPPLAYFVSTVVSPGSRSHCMPVRRLDEPKTGCRQ
jgi:hypothetical protein